MESKASSTEKWAEELTDKVLDEVDEYTPLIALSSESERALYAGVAAIISSHSPVKELVEALEFYANPFGRTDEDGDRIDVPDFYDEMDFGERARAILTKYKHQ